MYKHEKEYLMSLKKQDQYHFSIPFEYIKKKYDDDNYDIAVTYMEVDVKWSNSKLGYVITHSIPKMYLIDPHEGNGNEKEFYDNLIWSIVEEKLDDLGISAEAISDWG